MDTVAVLVIVFIDVDARGRHIRGDILVKSSAKRHVDQLTAPAYTKHRLAGLDELVQQLQFVHIAHAVAGPLGTRRLFGIGLR